MKAYKNSRISSEKIALKSNSLKKPSENNYIEVIKITNNYKFSSANKDIKSSYNSNNKPLINKTKQVRHKNDINTTKNIQNQIEEFSSGEEDSVWNNIPKPLNKDTVPIRSIKTSDFKKNINFINYIEGKNMFINRKHVTDLEASKFVDSILDQKLNNIN